MSFPAINLAVKMPYCTKYAKVCKKPKMKPNQTKSVRRHVSDPAMHLGCLVGVIYLRWVIKQAERLEWSPARLLEAWGLHQQGKVKSVAFRPATGAMGQMSDDYEQAATYVEQTFWFHRARPVLTWVYVKFGDVREFRPDRPGQNLSQAIAEHGWGELCRGRRMELVGGIVLRHFMAILSNRVQIEPFELVRPLEIEQGNGYEPDQMPKQVSLRDLPSHRYESPEIDLRLVGAETKNMKSRKRA